MSLAKYIARRIIASIIAILCVLVITFFITRALPGDPALMRLPPKATEERYLYERSRLGLDKPIYVQLIVFIQDMLTGNWGYSFKISRDSLVISLIMQRFPRSLEIMFLSMIIAIISGLRLGKIAGANKNSKKDGSIRALSYFFVSIPAFVVIIFVWQMNINTPFNIFPMGGYKSSEFSDPPTITYLPLLDCLISGRLYLFADYLWHLVVPVSAMTIVQLVIIMRQTRASMIDTMEQDYIRTVQAKGFSKNYIMNKHAFKNAAPSGIIASGLGFTIILGGMIAVEKIYQLPGLGYLFLRSIEWSDYPVIIATVFIFSVIAISFNFITDLVIALIDPRIKMK